MISARKEGQPLLWQCQTIKYKAMTLSNTLVREKSRTSAATLEQELQQLYQLIAPTWPLDRAVACNPLQGLEHLPFEEAARLGRSYFKGYCLPPIWQLRQSGIAPDAPKAVQALPDEIDIAGHRVSIAELTEKMATELDERQVAQVRPGLLANALSRLKLLCRTEGAAIGVNQDLLTWLPAFLDEGQTSWPMPGREKGFYLTVKSLLRSLKEGRKLTANLPDSPTEAIAELLGRLEVPQSQQQAYLRNHLLALPGWAAYIKWRSSQKDYAPQQAAPIYLEDYLAVRLMLAQKSSSATSTAPPAYEALHSWALKRTGIIGNIPAEDWATLLDCLARAYDELRINWLEQWESQFQADVTSKLARQRTAPKTEQADFQAIFCIDVRSEPFRKALEAVSHGETLGFAGFFGLPIAYETPVGKTVKSLPVLLEPAHQLQQVPAAGCAHQEQPYRDGTQLLQDLRKAYKALKYNLATPFAAAEALGLPAALLTLGRTLFPDALARLRNSGRQWFRPELDWVPDVRPGQAGGIPLEQQAAYAAGALRTMGLTRNFAPVVLLCGHGSETENNPYAAALDCGACGGSHGGPNAAAMASILNDFSVRKILKEENIIIPDETIFLAGQHNTTTDAVRLIALPELTADQQVSVQKLQKALQAAQELNLAARAPKLGAEGIAQLMKKRADWSEVRPEWGLAGNAGFVAAPRSLTSGLDLDGRCFLHSYDWQEDREGKVLEGILTAPLVVAQWINSQYFFSTTDNTAFGSGNKATHNVVSKVGIMQGNSSDLMHGLPWQSVMKNDDTLYHKPLRLTAFVQAPLGRVQSIIERQEVLQKLFFNQWVHLRVLDPETGEVNVLLPDGDWQRSL